MPPRNIEVSFTYKATVTLGRKRTSSEASYVAKAWVTAHDATPDEAVLAFGPADPERLHDIDEHRWYDGRLWTVHARSRRRDGDPPYDFGCLARDAADMEARSPEEDSAVRQVHGSDRAVREAAVRERYGNYMVLGGELWTPTSEPVLVVDTMVGKEYRVVAGTPGGVPHMQYRLDQVDWMVEEWGEPIRRPNLAVHRPDLLRARTTEAYIAGAARDMLQGMAGSLKDQGKAYFAAYHDLRTEAGRFAATVGADADGDMDALVAMVRAAAAAPAEDPRKDGRSRGEALHPHLLRRIERTQAAREPLPEFKP